MTTNNHNRKQGRCRKCNLAFVWRKKPLVRDAICPYCKNEITQTTYSVVNRLQHGRKKPLQNMIIDELVLLNSRINSTHRHIKEIASTVETRKEFIEGNPNKNYIKRFCWLCQIFSAYNRRDITSMMKRFDKEAPKLDVLSNPFGDHDGNFMYLWKNLEQLRLDVKTGKEITCQIEGYKLGEINDLLQCLSSEEEFQLQLRRKEELHKIASEAFNFFASKLQ